MPKPAPISLAQISYAMAYFILPGYAHQRLSKIEELCRTNPESAGAFFYVMACQLRKAEPSRSDGELFRWNIGSLDDETDHFVMVYPPPPPFDIFKLSEKEQTLAPYFSGIFRNKRTRLVQYYVLGQSPIGGGTTLRSVTVDPMVNSNLGPGPEPDLDSFLASIAFRSLK